MAVSKRLRFEVFKRDGFTCQYCARKTPDVVLEVDHIIPLAEGGGDEIENLATACFDCNRGKSAGLLDDRAPVANLKAQAKQMAEREDQLRAYNEVKRVQRQRVTADFDRAWNHWFECWDETSLPRWYLPWEGALTRAIERLGIEEVLEAIDITHGKFPTLRADAPKYLGGILRRKVARFEGRITSCTVCGRDIELEPGSDTTVGWHHNACEEK